jgi:Cysteine-rich secretory protein family
MTIGSSLLAEEERLEFPLRTVEVSPELLRLGRGARGRIAPRAQALDHGTTTFLFFDLDGDGRIVAGKSDGMGIEGLPFVVPLPRVFLLPMGQGAMEFSGGKLHLTPDVLPLDPAVLADAVVLTEIRIRAGLAPLPIDAELSRACAAHLDYLKQNDQTSGMGMHDEDPAKEGYTPEGAAAGRGASLFPLIPSLKAALWAWYGTAWHATPMFGTSARSAGVAYRHGLAALYIPGWSTLDRPFPHPADGALLVPREFGKRGEIPNPTPHRSSPKGCGFPILLRLAGQLSGRKLISATVTDGAGREIEGTHSCPLDPATPSWPTNSREALFIPEKPLAPDTTYRVWFRFEGRRDAVIWQFSTGKTIKPLLPDRLKNDAEVRKILRLKAPGQSFENQPFTEVVADLAMTRGLPIHLEEGARAKLAEDPAVTLQTAEMKLSELLEALCDVKGLRYRIKRGAVWVGLP